MNLSHQQISENQVRLMSYESQKKKIKNNNGPRTEPWGIPQDKEHLSDVLLFTVTTC